MALIAALCVPADLSAQTVVRGQIRSEGTGVPLSGAVVEVRGAGAVRSATAGPNGGYELREVAAGRRVVRAHHLGYSPFEVEVVVSAGRELELDIALRPEPLVLAPLRVDAGSPAPGRDTTAAPRAELGMASDRVLQSSPGMTELGLGDAAEGSPGQDPVDPSDVLYVRGAGTDLKLVYLDGAPVFAPFPLGGLMDPFTPDLLQSADIYLGGAPARYDGGLSYVLDLRTRGVRSDRLHSTGATDLLAARALIETPIGSRAGLLLAARSVHDLGTGRVAGHPLPYDYREGLARGDLRFGETGTISLTAFRNGEEVWLGGSGARDSVIGWGSSALSLRYRGNIGETTAELTAALSDFDARLPALGERRTVIEGWAKRSRLAADFLRSKEGVVVRYGASYDGQHQGYERYARPTGQRAEVAASADVAGAYGDLGWQISPRVRLRGGLRADLYTREGSLAIAPRLAATWLVTERATLTLAGGRYHQYLRPTENGLLGRDFAAQTEPDALALGRSTHLALALAQELSDGTRFGMEGYFKGFEGIPGGDAAAANASGVDVWLRRSVGSWTGWGGYSLAWLWSLPDENSNTRFAGRQLLTTGLGLPLGDRGTLEVGFAYGAGLPYSAIPMARAELTSSVTSAMDARTARPESSAGAAPLLPEPTRPYLRLDLAAARSFTTEWGGATTEIAPYVRLLNTLGNRDALFYRYDRERDDAPRPLVVLPVVPVLGVEWKF
ncbi:MAG: TonB-dependent receptor [Gemmatimonadetes bacterium]|nr:TonB-dependent receptor [Gemmatimonadota bacterium]